MNFTIGGSVIGILSRSITLTVNVMEDNPLVTPSGIKWFHNNSVLVSGPRIIFSSNRLSVTISNLMLSDEGTYTVIADNPAGSDSSSIFLDVEGIV